MTKLTPRNILYELCLLFLLAFLWGSSYLFTKVAVSEIPPLTLIAARVSIAMLFLLIVMWWQSESLPYDIHSWKMLFIQSLFNSTIAWTILAWGQQYVDSGLASVLNSTSPIFVFFISFFFIRRETTNALKFFGATLGLFGVILIVGVDALGGLGKYVLGQLATVTSAILYAFAALYGKRFSHLSVTVTATGTMICAALVLLPASLIFDQPWNLSPSIQALTAILIQSIFCTGFALLIYFRLVRTLGSLGVASQAYLRAGVGVLLGIAVLGEQITLVIGIGLLCTILGVAAINFPERKT